MEVQGGGYVGQDGALLAIYTAGFIGLAPGRELVYEANLCNMQVNYLNMMICADNKWISDTILNHPFPNLTEPLSRRHMAAE